MRYKPFIGASALCVLIVGAGLSRCSTSTRRPDLRTEARTPLVTGEAIPATDGAPEQDSIVHPPKPADSEQVRLEDFPMVVGASMSEIKTGSKDADVRVGLWPGAPGWVMRFMRRQMKEDLKDHDRTIAQLDTNGIYDHEDYTFRAVPVWMDADADMVTFSILRRREGASMHPMEYEYFLTFRLSDGRILGHADFWSSKEFDLRLGRLEKAVSYWYRDAADPVVYYYDSCVQEYLRSPEGITKEVYKGKMYPRPARVDRGYVFSYQVLEKGPRNFGVAHFLLY